MKPSALVQTSSAHQSLFPVLDFGKIKQWVDKLPTVGSLYVLSAVIASTSIGMTANSSMAQTYYDRPISTTSSDGYVATSTGIGLNIRSGPGLDYSIIGGAEDGVYLDLTGTSVDADGYRWRQLTTGGWVATEYIAGTTPVGYEPCYCSGVAYGGPAEAVQQSIVQPISTTAPAATASTGPYVVAIPGGDAQTIARVRRFIPRAYVDRAREGAFVNAGGYADYDGAKAVSYLLKANGLNARVIYR